MGQIAGAIVAICFIVGILIAWNMPNAELPGQVDIVVHRLLPFLSWFGL
jgi:hypothetical protein